MTGEETFEEMAPGPTGGGYPCKVDGCDRLAKNRMGPTAYLCPDHIAARARKQPSSARAKSVNGSYEPARDYRTEAQELRKRAEALDAVADAIAQLEAVEAS